MIVLSYSGRILKLKIMVYHWVICQEHAIGFGFWPFDLDYIIALYTIFFPNVLLTL